MDRPFEDLRDSGLLWLINRAVFHPRGFALALTITDGGQATGWSLLGDGSEPWQYGEVDVENDKFRRAEATLNGQRAAGGVPAGRIPGIIEVDKLPDGRFVIGRADQSIDVSLVLLTKLRDACLNRDGLLVFTGVDADGQPREVPYRKVGFNPTANPDANEGGFLLLERVA